MEHVSFNKELSDGAISQAVDTTFLLRDSGFDPKSSYMGLLVNKAAQRQFFS
jgi:hypothetical protein